VVATPENYDPKSQRILVSVNNNVAEATYNPQTKNITAKLDAPSTNANHPLAAQLPQNPDVRVKVFVYDFIKDRILGAKLQEFELNPQTFDYKATDEMVGTAPVILGNFDLIEVRDKAMKEEKITIKPRQIVKIEVSKGVSIDALNKEFTVDIFLDKLTPDNISLNQTVEVEIDKTKTIAKSYPAKDKKENQLYAKVKVKFPTVLAETQTYDLTAWIVDNSVSNVPKYGNSKIIKVKVNKDGSVSEVKENLARYEEITLKQIEAIYGVIKNQKEFRQEIVDNLNKYIKLSIENKQLIHVDTPLRKAHFFAQVGAETLGINSDWMVESDVYHYKVDSSIAAFGARAKKLKSLGKLEEYCKERPQKKLLNYVYAAENKPDLGNGDEASGDGYTYRGRGLFQLTGRNNYKNASNTLKEIFPNEYQDLEANPDLIKEPKYMVLSAIAYWEKNKVWKFADQIDTPKDKEIKIIRAKVNGGTKNWENCKKYFINGLKAFSYV
ncbi:MAG: glycoside hydrolase family 19 protein, partial [Flavobacterium sp.]|uniref:glycoside hydrolase family 19 protein n=1 Tax=Flavobacterium sp. TaxID=239 RepID=UPI003BBCC1D3